MQFMAEKYDKSCVGRLEIVRSTPFKRVTYTEAVDLLVEGVKDGKKFENHVEWGIDLASEHESWCLTEEKFKQLVNVYNYPKKIKAFYTKLNEDSKTMFAMDVVVPKVGELIGKGRALRCSKGKDSGDGRRHIEDYQSYLDLSALWEY